MSISARRGGSETCDPRAGAALHVGVLGGPERGRPETASIAAALRAVLNEIAAAARQTAAAATDLFVAEPPVLRCISPLERAAERIVAAAALAAGFKLQVPLPGSREFVTASLPDEDSRRDFDSLVGAAEVVVTLDRDPEQSDAVKQAFHGVVLDQTDILLVVEDADDPDGANNIMREARRRNIPVVAIGAQPPHAIQVIAQNEGRDGLSAVVEDILDPFRAADPARQAELRAAPRRYFGERSRSTPWYSRLHRLFERTVLVGWRAPAGNRIRSDGSEVFVPGETIAREFSRVDMLAIRYAHLYRSAFVLRYLLILPMAVGLIVGFFAATPAVRTIGFGIQWLAVVGTLALSQLGKRTDWHERFTTYRFLAELLRHQAYLARFGRTLQTTVFSADNESATSVWVIWQFRAVVRQDGLRAMHRQSVDCRYMAKIMRAFLDEQCDFYRHSAARYATIASRIALVGISLFWIDFVIITLRGGLIGYLRTAGWSSDPGIAIVLDSSEDILNELDIFLPSLAWIILALGDQGEYSRLSDQYGAMGEQARLLVAELDRVEPTYPTLVRIALDAAASLTSEVAAWRMLVSARTISYL